MMSRMSGLGAAVVAGLTMFVPCCASQPSGTNFAPQFIAGLSEVEGCLGVEAGRTMSGKSVIFA